VSRSRNAVSALAQILVLTAVLSLLAHDVEAQMAPRPAKEQRVQPWPKQPAPRTLPGAVARTGAVVPEVEPNNTAATATRVAVGDDVVGRINPANDVDWFAIDLEADTRVSFEVFASRLGSPLDSYLELYDVDGTTLLMANDDAEVYDSRIVFDVRETGRYYIAIDDYAFRGGENYFYQIDIRLRPLPPGDPTTVFAGGLAAPWATVALPGLTFFVVEYAASRISRVSGSGVTTVAGDLVEPLGLALDGRGDILVAHRDPAAATRPGRVTRIGANGQRSLFAAGFGRASAVAVAPDGDVWVADPVGGYLHRLSHGGARRDSISIAGRASTEMHIAFSPSGVLHFTDMSTRVFRMENRVIQTVITDSAGVGGLAFDRDGYLYLGSPFTGIHLYSPTYQRVHSPFSNGGMYQTAFVVFGRDAAGAMTDRLFGVNILELGTIREVNRAAVRAPGLRVGADLVAVTTTALRPGVMGAEYADTLRAEVAGVTWRIGDGQLPAGLTLSPAGVIAGVPEASGNYPLTIRIDTGGPGSADFVLNITRPDVSAAAAADHLLGGSGQLTPDQLRFLDLQGNRNGRFDIGDLRALIRGQAAAGSRKEQP
jgi:hypothetical protein